MDDPAANKSAAQRLRERMSGGKKDASEASAELAAGANPSELKLGMKLVGPTTQRQRLEGDEDVSTAHPVQSAEMVLSEAGEPAPEPVADVDGSTADWSFSELQNMTVRPDDMDGRAMETDGIAAEDLAISEEEALEVLTGHVGPDDEVEVRRVGCVRSGVDGQQAGQGRHSGIRHLTVTLFRNR